MWFSPCGHPQLALNTSVAWQRNSVAGALKYSANAYYFIPIIRPTLYVTQVVQDANFGFSLRLYNFRSADLGFYLRYLSIFYIV